MTVKHQLRSEIKIHNDLVIADFQDSYNNLTVKSTVMLKYLTDASIRAHHVVKVDDDVYVNFNLLMEEFSALLSHFPSFLCYIYRNAKPVRQASNDTAYKKWLIPHWMYFKPRFPPYCVGAFYAFDGRLVERLLEAAINTPIVTVEDIYVTGNYSSSTYYLKK